MAVSVATVRNALIRCAVSANNSRWSEQTKNIIGSASGGSRFSKRGPDFGKPVFDRPPRVVIFELSVEFAGDVFAVDLILKQFGDDLSACNQVDEAEVIEGDKQAGKTVVGQGGSRPRVDAAGWQVPGSPFRRL